MVSEPFLALCRAQWQCDRVVEASTRDRGPEVVYLVPTYGLLSLLSTSSFKEKIPDNPIRMSSN